MPSQINTNYNFPFAMNSQLQRKGNRTITKSSINFHACSFDIININAIELQDNYILYAGDLKSFSIINGSSECKVVEDALHRVNV